MMDIRDTHPKQGQYSGEVKGVVRERNIWSQGSQGSQGSQRSRMPKGGPSRQFSTDFQPTVPDLAGWCEVPYHTVHTVRAQSRRLASILITMMASTHPTSQNAYHPWKGRGVGDELSLCVSVKVLVMVAVMVTVTVTGTIPLPLPLPLLIITIFSSCPVPLYSLVWS
jgi:hypothetical protein